MIIVNFSTKEYAKGQQRLKNSLNGHKFLMFDNYEAIGSPSHKESPYEFKLHAIRKAAEFDPAILSAVAKAIVKNDVDSLLAKSNDIIDAVELARS